MAATCVVLIGTILRIILKAPVAFFVVLGALFIVIIAYALGAVTGWGGANIERRRFKSEPELLRALLAR